MCYFQRIIIKWWREGLASTSYLWTSSWHDWWRKAWQCVYCCIIFSTSWSGTFFSSNCIIISIQLILASTYAKKIQLDFHRHDDRKFIQKQGQSSSACPWVRYARIGAYHKQTIILVKQSNKFTQKYVHKPGTFKMRKHVMLMGYVSGLMRAKFRFYTRQSCFKSKLTLR